MSGNVPQYNSPIGVIYLDVIAVYFEEESKFSVQAFVKTKAENFRCFDVFSRSGSI